MEPQTTTNVLVVEPARGSGRLLNSPESSRKTVLNVCRFDKNSQEAGFLATKEETLESENDAQQVKTEAGLEARLSSEVYSDSDEAISLQELTGRIRRTSTCKRIRGVKAQTQRINRSLNQQRRRRCAKRNEVSIKRDDVVVEEENRNSNNNNPALTDEENMSISRQIQQIAKHTTLTNGRSIGKTNENNGDKTVELTTQNKTRNRKQGDLATDCATRREGADETDSDANSPINRDETNETDSEESDGLQEFLDAVEPKKPKYKPRRRRQLTEEEQAEKDRKSIEKRTCKICNMTFAFPGGLRNHMRSKHTFEKPYSCEFCGEKFSVQSSCSLHRRRHLGIKPHLCNLCGKTFLRKMDMRIHMRIHIPSKDKVRDVKCSFCPKVYTSKINLRKHTLTKHTDPSEWKHECQICNKKLYSATALTLHIRQHNDDRSHKCLICSRGFFTKQNLTIHIRTHSADTLFNCKLCPNGYRSNEALQRHRLKKHGIGEEKPVSAPTHFCPLCNEGFRQRARLDQHVELHETGDEEYPFECELCHKRYKARNYFAIHMMDKHGVMIDENYFKAFHLLNQKCKTAANSASEKREHSDYSDDDADYNGDLDSLHSEQGGRNG